MDTVKVDTDWLRGYAGLLERRADDATATLSTLREQQLQPEAFGDAGRELGTPQAYQRAADSLFAQLTRAEEVFTAAATALRQAADHYAGTDTDGARTLERGSGDDVTRGTSAAG